MFGGDADRSFVHVVMNETVVPLNIGVVFLSERDQAVHSTGWSQSNNGGQCGGAFPKTLQLLPHPFLHLPDPWQHV